MSIQPISFAEQKKRYNEGLSIMTGAGAVIGGVWSATQKNWLYEKSPSDSFMKNVSKNLRKTMTKEQLAEEKKINTFLKYAIDPQSDLDKLKEQIINSKELSAAIKNTPEESVEDAITRVYSNPDKEALRKDLLKLQTKTTSDKIANSNTVKQLIHRNLDHKTKTLVKSENTSEQVFELIKKSAKSAQKTSVAIKTGVGALVASALYIAFKKVPEKNKVK